MTVFLEPNIKETRHVKCMKCRLWWTMYQLVDLHEARAQQKKTWNNTATHEDKRSLPKDFSRARAGTHVHFRPEPLQSVPFGIYPTTCVSSLEQIGHLSRQLAQGQ